MSLRRIRSTYPGKCSVCGNSYHAGDFIWWGKLQKTKCDTCGPDAVASEVKAASSDEKKEKPKVAIPEAPRKSGATLDYTIDWSDLKKIVLQCFNDNPPKMRPHNYRPIREHLVNAHGSWEGFTSGQVLRWLKEGFHTDAIKGLSEFTPPLRSKRRTIFSEDGDELHIDRVLAGEESFMSKSTRRETIPGVSLDFAVTFSGGVDAKIINAYNVWICKTVYSLESVGIDAEVTMNFQTLDLIPGHRGMTNNRVKVKKEGEIADFVSFSPMLSPAAYRGFLFAVAVLHAESRDVSYAHGIGRGAPGLKWGVTYDRERRKILVTSDYSGWGSFPEERMTADLKKAMQQSMRGTSD